MGDKSPKSNSKQAAQKQSKDSAQKKQKSDAESLKQIPKVKK